MEYVIYKMQFPAGVHFGANSLEFSENVFYADTLFSALAIEALKGGESRLNDLIKCVKDGKLLLSDAMPFIGEEYYLPKPVIYIESNMSKGDSAEKKAYKKLKYIPVSGFKQYLSGAFDINAYDGMKELGFSEVKVSASIKEGEDTVPYRIGTYIFNENAGLYFIAGFEDEAVKEMLSTLIEELSYVGIGGRRSSGLGRFIPIEKRLPEEIRDMIKLKSDRLMTLSVALPKENEMEEALKDAEFLMLKRSGFVSSQNYADTYMRKRDLFVMAAGAVFANKFEGDVYDVSNGGRHTVLRYAKPMFLGI